MTVRVLHVQRAKGIGGSERHLLSLLPGLAAEGIEVRMCVLELDGGASFTAELRRADVDVAPHATRGDVDPRAVAWLVGQLRRFRPDIVHTHLIHADVHGHLAARGSGAAGVSSVHGTPAFYRRQPYRGVAAGVSRMVARRIAISEHVARFLREERLASPSQIRVVPYGVDVDAFGARYDPGRNDRDGTFTIAIAARLIEGKGHDVLIDAFARAISVRPGMRLVVAGDGPERARLEDRARTTCPEGTVDFLGFVDDVAAVMEACDVLAFPTQASLSEGFGLAALEAMAAGRPVVATAVGSLPEVVDDERTGLLVPPGSVEDLADAILRLAGDPDLGHRLGRNAAARARAEFTLQQMVRRTIAVYEEVA